MVSIICNCLYITDIVYDDTLMRVQWNIGRVYHNSLFTLELWNGTIYSITTVRVQNILDFNSSGAV